MCVNARSCVYACVRVDVDSYENINFNKRTHF